MRVLQHYGGYKSLIKFFFIYWNYYKTISRERCNTKEFHVSKAPLLGSINNYNAIHSFEFPEEMTLNKSFKFSSFRLNPYNSLLLFKASRHLFRRRSILFKFAKNSVANIGATHDIWLMGHYTSEFIVHEMAPRLLVFATYNHTILYMKGF